MSAASYCKSSGPSPCEVLIVGEAPGQEEDTLKLPFIGSAGKELRDELIQAGFEGGKKAPLYSDQQVRMTNVFGERPPGNDIDKFCGKRSDVGKEYALPALGQGKWVLPKYLHHLDLLRQEIHETNPRLIIALGNTATWALLRRTGIGKLRGNIFLSELAPGIPVLPTYHPSYILRSWEERVIAVGDFIKAKRFLDEGFAPRRRELWLRPTLVEVREFFDRYILRSDYFGPLSFDIETAKETITCIGFAPDLERSITVPFFDATAPGCNYWATPGEELEAWRICYQALTTRVPKLGQNGLYDIQYCRRYGIPVRGYQHDTMIRHHALYPELEKGLGFMASLYTDEQAWKVTRDRNRDNFKIDDE